MGQGSLRNHQKSCHDFRERYPAELSRERIWKGYELRCYLSVAYKKKHPSGGSGSRYLGSFIAMIGLISITLLVSLKEHPD